MAEDVQEEPPAGGQPGRDALQQPAVVADVLEHLHRDDAVVPPGRGEGVDVRREDGHVGETALLRRLGDGRPL